MEGVGQGDRMGRQLAKPLGCCWVSISSSAGIRCERERERRRGRAGRLGFKKKRYILGKVCFFPFGKGLGGIRLG